jgi:hypothetical protein
MALQFDIDVFAAKDARELFDCLAPGTLPAPNQCGGQRPFVTARQAYQTGGVLVQIVEGRSAIVLRHLAHLELGHELTEVLIAFPRLAEQWQPDRFRFVTVRQPCGRRKASSET